MAKLNNFTKDKKLTIKDLNLGQENVKENIKNDDNKLAIKDLNLGQENDKENIKNDVIPMKNNLINSKTKNIIKIFCEQIFYNQPELFYERDINKYILELENKYKLSDKFLKSSITNEMRMIVVDWLTEVQHYLRIGNEELFLGIKIMDMVIDQYPPELSKLQLVGVLSLWISHKYFSRKKLKVKDLLILCENIYSSEEFLKMEKTILKIIHFDLNYTEPLLFLIYYSHKFNISEEVFYAANYFLDLISLKAKYSMKSDSLKAAGALYTAIELLEPKILEKNNEMIIGDYSKHQCLIVNKDIKMILYIISIGKSKFSGAFNKYKSSLYNKISVKLSQIK